MIGTVKISKMNAVLSRRAQAGVLPNWQACVQGEREQAGAQGRKAVRNAAPSTRNAFGGLY